VGLLSGNDLIKGKTMAKIPARHAFVQQLLADGVKVIFGNPGTVEQSILDTLTDYPELGYILGLQESVVVAMADGYARATKQPAIVQLHAAVGLGNAIAMLYQAHRSFTPLVVFAGETYSNLQAFDGFLGGDTTEIARPVTKWSARITHGSHLPRILRRALKVAATPPQGPVYLAIPMDVLEEEIEPDIHPTSQVPWRGAPDPAAVAIVAQALVGARNPLMLVGDVSVSGGQRELQVLSDQLGCPIYGVDFADLSASFTNPLFLGLIGHSSGETTRAITLEADVVLAVGTPLFPELFPSHSPYFQEGARVFQVDLNPWEIAKNYPVEVGIWADPKITLKAISSAVEPLLTPEARQVGRQRQKRWKQTKMETRAARQADFDRVRDRQPMPPSRVMEEVVAALPENVVIYDESITSTDELLHFLQPAQPDSYFLGRGGCIGVGWPGAVGAKIANPDRPVLALSGDGSSLYVIQVLWTAAHYNLDMVFLVCNNKSYRILKVNLLNYWARLNIAPRPFPFMDLDSPAIRFDKIAEGFGVRGWRATDPLSLKTALTNSFAMGGPHLIDVEMDGSVTEELRTVIRSHCGCA
jgi:benzoylformate decarboxylase